MFTIEIKINGAMVGHVYGRNVGQVFPTTKECLYTIEYYKPDLGPEQRILKMEVSHNPDDGIEALLQAIINRVKELTPSQ